MKLIAIHAIELVVTPGTMKEGEDGLPKIARYARTRMVKPGVIFEETNNDVIKHLKDEGAAREPTERELKMAGIGLVEVDETKPSTPVEKTPEPTAKADSVAAARAARRL